MGDCIAFASDHRQPLALADLNHQLADDSELPLWRAMQAYFSALSSRAAYLDVGCGTARIIMLFAGLFDSVTCVEADPDRISSAKRNWQENTWGRSQQSNFVNSRFDAFKVANASFDAVSCIQVVQHIPERELQDWLKSIHRLLKPKGVFVFATKHRPVDVYEL